ncbi:hypothetical protein QTG54_006374 [Skeletonema marinoi]|uniref:BspA family leucine-rich repeat surface protein n=1 Tax=Skeletonema marinoi TaxID=267567 RepID=A0AAD8YC71_9STRA|nr:hypothetical protein QTG54_006374 [Skeletonema marinoi]
MEGLFSGASAFNEDISAWDTSSDTNMDAMFSGASAFNQNLCAWKDKFPYSNAMNIFLGSGCTFTQDPQLADKGPFCSDDCGSSSQPSTVPSCALLPANQPNSPKRPKQRYLLQTSSTRDEIRRIFHFHLFCSHYFRFGRGFWFWCPQLLKLGGRWWRWWRRRRQRKAENANEAEQRFQWRERKKESGGGECEWCRCWSI